MKVLVVCDGIWPPEVDVTGVSGIYKLQKYLSNFGIEVHILTATTRYTDISWREWSRNEEKSGNIHFHFIHLKILKQFSKLHYLATKFAYFFAALGLIFKYQFDIVHEYSSLPLQAGALTICKLFSGVRIFHTQCTYTTSQRLFDFLRKIPLPVDRVICVTSHLQRRMLEGCSQSKIAYLPLGINCERFSLSFNQISIREKLGISPNNLIVLYLGLIDERKGVFTFLRAVPSVLEEHPNVIFIIATSGHTGVFYDYDKNRSKLLELLKNNEKIIFLEGRQGVPSLMGMADVFVLPLVTPNGTLGYPLTLLEAMASGKAIVASDIAGVDELILNGKTGLLVNKGDSQELAKTIVRLLSDKELRKKLADNAKNHVKEYDINIVAKRLKKMYIKACDAS